MISNGRSLIRRVPPTRSILVLFDTLMAMLGTWRCQLSLINPGAGNKKLPSTFFFLQQIMRSRVKNKESQNGKLLFHRGGE